jgi:dTDP-glucose 4,6-dehydratase
MKRVLLTGVGGSIGCHTLIHIFHNTDWEVVGTDSFRHKGWMDRVTEVLKMHPQYRSRLTIVTHDLTAPFSELTKKKIGHIDYIINMAALSDVGASIEPDGQITGASAEFVKNNVSAVLNMLDYAREIKPEAFIQISTDEVYGATEKTQAHPEWSPIIPSNPYSASKACQEAIAISYWRTYNVPVIITNTMNNFGEMQQGSKYPAMLQKWIDKGETVIVHGTEGDVGTRYYLHSRNHADALLYILKNLPPYMHKAEAADKPDRYNIVGDVQLSNLELAQEIAKIMGKELKFQYKMLDFHSTRPGHDKHYGLDGEKLHKLGWKSPVGFEESMRNTIKWQQENPEWIA